jgi:WD40 repeat protein
VITKQEPYEYRVGGSLPEHAPSYTIRQADRDFYAGLKAGNFCYVFNSRQMGKTSLLVRTLYRLRGEGVACTTIDVSGRGSGNIQPEQWYAGIVYTLIKDFKLGNPLQFMKGWWKERDFLDPAQRLVEFIEAILLPNTTEPIVIFIDEIDSILSLNFSTDDFFALIRSCYDKRATNSAYNRLTFALIGVARPSDLINDKRRTPFNIGRAIELSGFTLDEADALTIGLRPLTDNPHGVLGEILAWTGGQPFLTQKICSLLVKSDLFVAAGEESIAIERLVRSEAIEDWESRDNPPHFKTISTRLTANETRSGSLLGLYQQILTNTTVKLEDRPEERELQLAGIVVKIGDELKVANRIYAAIFDRLWVDKQLANLRPYSMAIKEWVGSNKTDKSRLLRGKALEDALEWAKGKNLTSLDGRFLSACREQRIYEANQEVLQQRIKQLWLLSALGCSFAICALFFGFQARSEKEKAQIAGINAKNALNQALIESDKTKNAIETLIDTLDATRLFQEQKQLLNQTDRQKLAEGIETNLQYAIHGTLERNRLKHDNTVTDVNYSPDGKFIASVSKDKTLKIWQVDGKLIQTIPHPQALHDLSISNDSQKIVTVGDDSQVRVWDINGKQLAPHLDQRNDTDKFIRVAITPDSKYIAAATNTDRKNAEVIIWEVESGKIIKTFQFPKIAATINNRTHGFRDLKFSTDGKFLAAASTDTTIKVWAWETARSPQILTGHRDWAYSLSFSQDGKWLASAGGGSDESMKIWQINDGRFQLKKTIEKIHDGGFYLAFHPNNRQIATAGSGDRTIKLWDFDRIMSDRGSTLTSNDWGNILLTTIGGNQSEYKGIIYSPDGRRFALPGTDYQVTIWEPDRALERNISASQLVIQRVIYSHNGQYIATGGSDNIVRIWQADGILVKTIPGHKDWIYGLSFSPDDKSIASASEDNTVKIWQIADGRLLRTLKHDNYAYDVSYSPDSRYLASVGEDRKLKIWDAHNGKLFKEFTIANNDHWIWRVKFSPDNKYLAINTSDGVELYSTKDFTKVRVFHDNGQKMKTLLQVNFSPDSQTIAAASIDGMVRLWNIEDGKSIVKYQGHRDAISDIQFSPDSQEIATVSGGDRSIKFWSRKGELRRTIEGFKGMSLTFSPDGTTVIAVDTHGVMKFWNLAKLEREYLTLEASYAKGCDRLQEYLSHRQQSDSSQEMTPILQVKSYFRYAQYKSTKESICQP